MGMHVTSSKKTCPSHALGAAIKVAWAIPLNILYLHL